MIAMSRTLVIGDIHGGLKALTQIFERAKITEQDTLIFLGDYVDGWSESPGVLDFLIALKNTHNCIFIRGNHDDLLYNWLTKGEDTPQWYIHGGEATVLAYQKLDDETKKIHIDFLKNLGNYYLDDQNRLFVHGGFSSLNGVDFEYSPEVFYWDRTLWEMALALDPTIPTDSVFYPKRFLLYKEIFIGHTPLTRINEVTPIQKSCIWNVDTGAAFKGRLTVMDIDTKQFWQSDNLNALYPNEKGRN